MAALIDGIIVGITINAIVRVNYSRQDEELMTMFLYACFCAIMGAFLYPMWSGNIGHRIMGIKVISVADGTDSSGFFRGALREFLKTVSIYLLIPSIWILWDSKRQNLYDKALGTIVVKRRRQ